MSDDVLLPPNATVHERAMAGAVSRLSDVPLRVRDAWNPDTCPAELLPWLAWAFSVDEWQDGWTEAEQRAVIKNALYVHKKKGTLAALKRAVEPLGYIIRIVEWFEESPPGTPFTFRLEVGVLDKGIDESIYDRMTRIIQAYKNVRSQMLALTIKGETRGTMYFGAGLMSGVDTTVYPWTPEDMEHTSSLYFAAAELTTDTVVVEPQTA